MTEPPRIVKTERSIRSDDDMTSTAPRGVDEVAATLDDALRRSLAHHHELVAALTAPDPDWAESVMRSHVRAAWHSIRLGDGGDQAPGPEQPDQVSATAGQPPL
ncbi:FCD domain-containing protein [Micromonospora taraxaci]|uniref:FCD domain-containing protein n=1 Tax=Micromonospora taraxaci TaxID=1316803 RepID=UPI0033BC1BB4